MFIPMKGARPLRFLHAPCTVLAICLLALTTAHGTAGAAGAGWSAAAHTLQVHVWASAVTGSDGRVYVFGNDSAHNPQRYPVFGRGAEVYTPSDNRWTRIKSMPTARSRTAAATVPDGKIYVLGGLGAGGARRTAAVYDPGTGAWSTVTQMPIGGSVAAAATGPDGKIYVFGGHRNRFGADGHGDLDTVQIYDPTTNAWTVSHSMPVPLETLSAVTGADGRIYVMGGWNAGPAVDEDRMWAYDTRTGTFTPVASMPQGRETFGAVAGPNGTIYVIAGDTSRGSLTAVDVYTIATNTWSSGPPLPAAETALSAARSGDTLYAIGGTGPGTDFIHGTKAVWSLTP